MWKDIESAKSRSPRLPKSVVRIVASIGLLPAMFGIFFVTGFALNDLFGFSDSSAFVGAYVLVAMLTLVIWVRIWWEAVAWSQRVLWMTVLWAMMLMVLPSLGILFISSATSIIEAIMFCLPVIGWGLWMAGTVRYWPMKVAAGGHHVMPRCMRCDYLLTGLRGTRCPECGDEPTLDELWAATAGEQL